MKWILSFLAALSTLLGIVGAAEMLANNPTVAVWVCVSLVALLLVGFLTWAIHDVWTEGD